MEPSDALAVVLVLRADEPARFERAIVRWRALLCHEARGLGACEAQLMLAALQALCGPAAAPAGRLLAELRTVTRLADSGAAAVAAPAGVPIERMVATSAWWRPVGARAGALTGSAPACRSA